MAAIESQHRRLAEIFDANTAAFSEGMKVLESMDFIFQRVMNDLLHGTVRCVGDSPPESEKGLPIRSGFRPNIDFQSYVREYWSCMVMADFATWLKSLIKEEPAIVAPSKEDVIEFGGDG